MDGRRAVMNVLMGVMIGALVPVIGAIALSQAHHDFRWIDHLFTILILSIVCAAVGVLINLPWSLGSSTRRSGAASFAAASGSGSFAGAGSQRMHDRKASEDAQAHRKERRRSHHASNRPRRYAMSRREALRTLELQHDAAEDAVRESYRRLAKEHHPDRVASEGDEAMAQATQKFQQIRAAYEVLVDEEG